MTSDCIMKRLLTPLELKVMSILWKKERCFVKDMLTEWDEEPKPAYNTISTIVRILEEKEFIGHKAYGRTHEYFAVVDQETYQKGFIANAVEHVFSGSAASLVSTLVDQDYISPSDLEALKKLIQEKS